jgi:hypothetical protein
MNELCRVYPFEGLPAEIPSRTIIQKLIHTLKMQLVPDVELVTFEANAVKL